MSICGVQIFLLTFLTLIITLFTVKVSISVVHHITMEYSASISGNSRACMVLVFHCNTNSFILWSDEQLKKSKKIMHNYTYIEQYKYNN